VTRGAPTALHGAACAALAAAVLLAGCGKETEDPAPPDTAFAAALGTIGGGAGGGEPGFGWVDVPALGTTPEERRQELRWAADALAPGADDIARGDGTAPTGMDPAQAKQIVSVAGSYAIGVRFDGVDETGTEEALRGLARPKQSGDWTIYDVSETATTPFDSPLEGLSSYPSRSAVMPGSVVLARYLVARTALIGSGDSPVGAPLIAAAASCLGDVVAARIVPNNFTYAGSEAPQLFAFGVRSAGDGRREVLCVLDEDRAKVSDAAAGMERAFAPGATDVVTDQPIDDLIAGAEIETLDLDGVPAARAELEPARGEIPGFLFRAFPRGSTLTYVGVRHPFPEGVLSED
jgi:hypothetical protein